MKEHAKISLTALVAMITVCALMFGAYAVGTATQTIITVVIERAPSVSVLQQAQSEAQTSTGINLPMPKPSQPHKGASK